MESEQGEVQGKAVGSQNMLCPAFSSCSLYLVSWYEIKNILMHHYLCITPHSVLDSVTLYAYINLNSAFYAYYRHMQATSIS